MAIPDDAFSPRPLGRTGLRVTPLCLGGGPLGSMVDTFGYAVAATQAEQTVRRFLQSPLRFLDTAPSYGHGRSEARIGAVLAELGGLPADVVLATKVDRDPETGDYSGRQVRRSFDASLERLGVDRVHLLHLHDPELTDFASTVAAGGAVEELLRIQEEGLADVLGVAGGPVRLMADYLATGAFGVLLTHNRWTLVDRSAGELISWAVGEGIGVINGAPFGGGILARGSAAVPRYAYRPASAETLRRVRAMEEACSRAGVPLPAAALQFFLGDPRIAATVVGLSAPEEVEQTLRHATWPIPEEVWDELDLLVGPRGEWLM